MSGTFVDCQVGCSMLKADLRSVSLLMNLQRWPVIREDISLFQYVTELMFYNVITGHCRVGEVGVFMRARWVCSGRS